MFCWFQRQSTGAVKSGTNLQVSSTDGHPSRIGAKRRSRRVDERIYQTTDFSDDCLPKNGAEVAQSFLDAAMINIHTGWYVKGKEEPEAQNGQTTQF